MARGRVLFAKFSGILNLFAAFFGVFPRPVRMWLLLHCRGVKGKLGLGLRYALLKSTAKQIGQNVSVHPDVVILNPQKLVIGDHVSIHPFCYIDACGGITIGNDVSIAHGVSLLSFEHKYSSLEMPIKDQGVALRPITLTDNIWIGAKATILGGVTIHSGSIVGANAVVTKDVPENAIYAGVPAKLIKKRSEG